MKRTNLLLVIILVIALALRIVNIENNPPAMYGDELTMVLDVNSILYTGYDSTGEFLPLNFSMGGGRPVGYGYFSLPFVAVFGTTALAIRMLSILSGVGLVLLMYFLGEILFSKKVGLVAAGVLAVSPWDISLSRGGFEAHFALFLSVAGLVLFLKAKQNPKFYVLSAVMFGLAVHTYSTFKLLLPLFAPLLIWFGGVKNITLVNRRFIMTSALVLMITFGLVAYKGLFTGSETRFNNLNIFSQQDLKQQIVQKIDFDRNTAVLPIGIAKLFHNRPIEYTEKLVESYFKNFSMDFLFLTGDREPRHNMATHGQLYMVEIFTIFFGLGFLWKHNKKILGFLIGWLLIAPTAATLLLEQHALRDNFMLPPLILLSSLGLISIWNIQGRFSKIKFLVILAFIIQFLFFAERLYFLSGNQLNRFWSYPTKQAVELAIKSKNDFNYVILSSRIDNAEFAYPVYARINPQAIQHSYKIPLGEYLFKKYDENVYIGDIAQEKIVEFVNSLKGSVIYIGSVDEAKNFGTSFDTFYNTDLQPSFVVLKRLK